MLQEICQKHQCARPLNNRVAALLVDNLPPAAVPPAAVLPTITLTKKNFTRGQFQKLSTRVTLVGFTNSVGNS